jgi:Cytochrome b(N-terminal)/b6/petB
MSPHVLAAASSVINLNAPGSYWKWSIFYLSVANLVLIGAMVVIFGLALILPFPHRGSGPGGSGTGTVAGEPAGEPEGMRSASAADPADRADPDADMWTARARRLALRLLPPGKLLPDRQPAYVASWIYVFGVASLAALGLAIVSGFALALGGPDWWHYNPVGHFCNSVHLWSVELFMALLVIHLWGKFWMAAWRGRRAMTWITGVLAFLASIVECFTGYLSQQNFDAQWISTSGKDAFDAAGVGGFFNLMNFGQMLMWHIVLLPIVLVAIVGAHILLVRIRGVSHPLPAKRVSWRDRAGRKAAAAADAAPWRGPTRRYDLLKEGTAATAIALCVTLALAGLLSSPDVPSLTVQAWSRIAPADFIGTAASELAGTSETATYGPPYNNVANASQRLLFSPEHMAGVLQPVNPARAFVLHPLAELATTDPALTAALATYSAAPARQQVSWATAYATVAPKARFSNGVPVVPAAKDGPVPTMLAAELALARSGALDADLLAAHTFYGTNYTLPLLFIEDGQYFANKAQAMNLGGDQWGVMNETGSYPGQPWLWLYTLWYQIPKFGNSFNADLIAIYWTGLATLLLLFVPFIPGLRDIPRLIPVHRLIWRGRYDQPSAPPAQEPAHAAPGPDGSTA